MAFAVYSRFLFNTEQEVEAVKAAVAATAKHLQDSTNGNVVTFHLHHPDPARSTLVHLLETYTQHSAYTEVRKDELVNQALNAAGLNTCEENNYRKTLVLGYDLSGVHAKFRMDPRPVFSQPEDGSFTIHPSPETKVASAEAVLLEVRFVVKDNEASQVHESLSNFIQGFKDDASLGAISINVVEGGFGQIEIPASSKQAVDDGDWELRLLMIVSNSKLAAVALTKLDHGLPAFCMRSPTVLACGNSSTKWDDSLAGALKILEGAGFTVFSTTSLAGFLNAGSGGAASGGRSVPPPPRRGVDTNDSTESDKSRQQEKAVPFSMSYGAMGDPYMLFISDSASSSSTSSSSSPFSPSSSGSNEASVLRIPLMDLLKKILGRAAATGNGIPAELLFSRLGRFRGLLASFQITSRINQILEKQEDAKEGEAKVISDRDQHEVAKCVENLVALGYALPSKYATIEAEHLADLIALLEEGYGAKHAQATIVSDNKIEYNQLFEYYRVGDIVKAPASSLGSTSVFYRVCDAYYESVRSIMGQRKLSFHLGLEYIATLGDNYAFISFEQIIGDWERALSVEHLPYIRVKEDSAEFQAAGARGQSLLELGLVPTYRSYRGACFFGHGARANAADLSEDGRLVVDTVRGLALGNLVARGNDEPCLAYQLVVKAYRAVQRARADGQDSNKMAEQLQNTGLHLMNKVPSGLGYMIWPAVVGFSLGLKRWGHVLVEGLRPVVPNPVPWEKLVLPPAKKELLLSLVEANFDLKAPRLPDIVSNKGAGSLFLLHGVPGTGKTLTVMALAEKFAVPAYYLTFGELGTSVKELETTMGDVLTMCGSWGALVLLDEGDALVERREKGALLLNSMVGVLLKALDAFEGLLFITTNRVAAFDPAALSRVTLAIRFSSLKSTGRVKVWHNVLLRAGSDPSGFDLQELAKRGGSGRDINGAARLALNLAYHRKVPISQQLLLEVLDVQADFRKDFDGGMAPHAEVGRVSDDDD